jgi:hypothetical protein
LTVGITIAVQGQGANEEEVQLVISILILIPAAASCTSNKVCQMRTEGRKKKYPSQLFSPLNSPASNKAIIKKKLRSFFFFSPFLLNF